MSTNQIQVFTIKTNFKGSLSITFEDVDGVLKDKKIILGANRKTMRLPAAYALSIFTNPSIERSFKRGTFSVLEEQELYKLAYERGLYSDFVGEANAQTMVDYEYKSEDEIKKIILGKNTVALKKYLEDISDFAKQQLLAIAKENMADLTTGNIEIIEAALETILPKMED